MKDNGGQAFPVPPMTVNSSTGDQYYAMEGMSLRDYFAAKAMRGLIAEGTRPSHRCTASDCDGNTHFLDETEADIIARESYFMADAMIAERIKP